MLIIRTFSVCLILTFSFVVAGQAAEQPAETTPT